MTRGGSYLWPWVALAVVLPVCAEAMRHPSLAEPAYVLLLAPLLWTFVTSGTVGVIGMTVVTSAARAGLEVLHRHLVGHLLGLSMDSEEILPAVLLPVALYVALTYTFLLYRRRQLALQEQLLARERLEAIGRLAGGLAHDFNNVLTVVQGTAEITRRQRPNLDPAVREDLDTIIDAAKRGAVMIEQILTVGRNDQPPRPLLDLNLVVQDSLRHVRPAIHSGVQIATHLAEKPLTVQANALELHQVILNLCINADDAMNGTGELTIRTQSLPVEPRQAARQKVAAGEYAVLSVTDAGTGMSAKTLRRTFEPFFTTKPPGQGTGLGLSVVRHITRRHGGFIEVDSAPGKGRTFHIYLPVGQNS